MTSQNARPGRVLNAPEATLGRSTARGGLAQATVFLAVAPKSDSVSKAYFAAQDDVTRLGAQPIPLHLRNAADRRMKQHGIGVGYKNSHDFEGDDVAQRYLPGALGDRRYYRPGAWPWPVL